LAVEAEGLRREKDALFHELVVTRKKLEEKEKEWVSQLACERLVRPLVLQ